jgi:hypothetical protein
MDLQLPAQVLSQGHYELEAQLMEKISSCCCSSSSSYLTQKKQQRQQPLAQFIQ